MKKIPEDNIILHLFTTNDNHMIYDLRYGVWQTEFFAILDYFLPFYTPPPPPLPLPPNNPENQNFEKMNYWRYYHYHFNHMMYGS